MKHYQYLIIGGGLTGDAAARGILELDVAASIGMISKESDPPYARPSLSKGLWKGRPVGKIWRNTRDLGVELYLERTVTDLDPTRKYLRDNAGGEYTYDKLLLATGGSPIRLPFGDDNIIYYRDFQDYHRLRAATERGEHFLVIGGGFIGSEIAAALTMIGKKVVMIFPEKSIGANIYPSDLSQFLNDFYREKGVEVVAGDAVTSLEKTGDRSIVRTRAGRSFEVDGVVAGIGIRPNLELAQQAGLQVDNGIVVNEHLLTSAPDIFAAGDVAKFYHSALGKGVRVEHEDNALRMGKLAGRNMAGADEPYTHVPMFYSDLFELGYEAVGELSSKLETVADWEEPFKKGVVYYLSEGRVRGVLLWNVWDAVPEARALLKAVGPFRAADLIGRLSSENQQSTSMVLMGANK
ncbi:MAG: NAD(P)/FAD-dependent oxidoreductase [Anaerolineales bacterium]|jgi:3-phenylpropionate/trans-cinnamate dioxygenase ferredoxin reductase subunit|nr:NAD(P)/FAD-dependent oxidoreductase [Anaerolineales bacterium]